MGRGRKAEHLILFGLLYALISQSVAGQWVRDDDAKISLQGGAGMVEVPIEFTHGLVVLPISVNGSAPLRIILDTGMPTPGLLLFGNERTTALDLGFDPTIQLQVRGAGGHGQFLNAQVAPAESLSLPGVSIESMAVLFLPDLPHFSVFHDGTIGGSLLRRFVIEIDFENERLRFYQPDTYVPSVGADVVPFSLRRGIPHIVVRMTDPRGGFFDAEVVVDLGAFHAISLNTDSSERIQIPQPSLETYLGRGISGPLLGRLGRVAALELGASRLANVLATFPTSKHQNPRRTAALNGNLGAGILRRFKTTFDYKKRRMLLEPNRALREPFLYDRSGLVLAFMEELVVEYVVRDSPADEAGVQVGDVVTHFNNRAVSSAERQAIRNLLEGDGTVRLRLRRDGESIDIALTLRKLI